MRDFIDNNLDIFKEVVSFYENYVHTELDAIAKSIISILNQTLQPKSDQYGLSISNSVTHKELFKIEYRIKGSDNLLEKFIRKNEGLRFTRTLGLTTKECVSDKVDIVKVHLKRLDDVIGIKILTELKADCENVYKLIQDNEPELKSKYLTFYDLKNQPCKMKNGLKIFNIKGCFQNECNFELQIKSKIDSAWGDLDHSLFYKEYAVTPIRDTVQVSMNRIGMLLNELEGFLYDIRMSNSKYDDKAENIKYGEYFYSQLTQPIKAKLGFEYDISSIIGHLRYIHLHLKMTLHDKPPQLNFDFMKFCSGTKSHLDYCAIRNQDFKLIILEAAYMSWQRSEISAETYPHIVDEFLSVLDEYLHQQTCKMHPELDGDQIKEHRANIFPYLLQYHGSSSIYMSPVLHSRDFILADLGYTYLDIDDAPHNTKLQLLLAARLLSFGCDYAEFISHEVEEDYNPSIAKAFFECINDMKLNDQLDKMLVEDFEEKTKTILKHWGAR